MSDGELLLSVAPGESLFLGSIQREVKTEEARGSESERKRRNSILLFRATRLEVEMPTVVSSQWV